MSQRAKADNPLFLRTAMAQFAPARIIMLIGAFGLVLCFSPSDFGYAQTTAPLLQKTSLIYEGAFRLPQGTSDAASFSYGGTAVGLNPVNHSLLMTGHDWYQLSAEVSIPAIINTTDISQLATAAVIQSFTDPTEGTLSTINPADPNSKKIGGHFIYRDKLLVTAYSYYDGDITQRASHFIRPINLSLKGQVQGPVKVGSQYPGFVAGYMTEIPAEWQSLFGGPALTGNCCVPGASWQSQGPAASIFDPAQIGQVSPVPATAVLGYTYPNVLGPGETTTNPLYNLTTRVTGIVFPPGTRSVLFFGRHGIGTYCYGEGATCGDPADSSKGTHAYPYVYQVWAYDANDLVSVKNGTKYQHEVKPYATWTFNLPFERPGDAHWIGGAVYDPSTRRIYLSQRCEDTNCVPIMHVFRIASNGDATAPPPARNLRFP